MSYLPMQLRHIISSPQLLHVLSSVLRRVLCSAASTSMSYLPMQLLRVLSSVQPRTYPIFCAASTCHIFRCSFDMSYLPCFISSLRLLLTCNIFRASTCPMFRGFYMSYVPRLRHVISSLQLLRTCHIFYAASLTACKVKVCYVTYSGKSMKQGVGGCDVAPHIHVHIYTSYFPCNLASTRPILRAAWLLHVLFSLRPSTCKGLVSKFAT
jgi:hypothetical protein